LATFNKKRAVIFVIAFVVSSSFLGVFDVAEASFNKLKDTQNLSGTKEVITGIGADIMKSLGEAGARLKDSLKYFSQKTSAKINFDKNLAQTSEPVGNFFTRSVNYITDIINNFFASPSTTPNLLPAPTQNETTETNVPAVVSPGTQQTPQATTKVIERIITTTPAPVTQPLVSSLGFYTKEEMDAVLRNYDQTTKNDLISRINNLSASTNSQYAATNMAVALTNKIDSLSNVTLTNVTVKGASGLEDSDIPDGITASNYLLLAGGNITGNLGIGTTSPYAPLSVNGEAAVAYLTTSSSTATSTFVYGINLKGGCFAIDGVCVTGSGLGGTADGAWSTTSADFWETTQAPRGVGFSTTSADYYLSQNQGAAFSTSSADYNFSANLSATNTGAIAEGSNKYYTDDRVAGVIAATTTDALTQGATNKYYSTNLLAADLAATTTTALAEGDNKYFTNDRVAAVIAGTTTTAIAEGEKLYFTDTRADDRAISVLSATTSLPNVSTLSGLVTFGSTTATTTGEGNLKITGNAELGTVTSGAWNGTAIGDAYLTKTGDWTGTFDGQEGSYYLDARNLTNFGSPFFSFFSATTTDALAQGSTNKYWSQTLFDNALSATTSLPNITTLASLSLPVTQLSGNYDAKNLANFGTPFFSFFSATTTDALTQGSTNKYWSQTLFDNALTATTTLPKITTLSSLSLPVTQLSGNYDAKNLANFGTPFFTYFNGTTTDALAQGSINKYYSTDLLAADLAATTTTALAEGDNKYFTNDRVAAVIAGTTTTAIAEGEKLYFTNTRADDRAIGVLSATTSLPNVSALSGLATFGSGTATTTAEGHLKVTGNTELGTVTAGIWNGTAIGDAYLTKTGDWTGTFDGQEGSYYLNAKNLTNFGSPFFSFFSATTTDALAEGSINKYWSQTLFDNALTATTTLPKITTLLGLTNATTTNLTITSNAYFPSGIWNSSGNVGIGTSNPTHDLETYTSGGAAMYLGHSNASGSFPKVSAIGLGSNAVSNSYSTNGNTMSVVGSAQIAAIQSQSSGAETDLALYTATGGSVTERMRINSAGNIGIGTVAPANVKLEVSGAATADTNGNGVSLTQTLTDTTAFATGVGGGLGFAGYYTANPDRAVWSAVKGFKENSTTGNYAGALSFYTRANGGSLTEKLRIDSTGNIGIGTTTPAQALTINSTVSGIAPKLQILGGTPLSVGNVTAAVILGMNEGAVAQDGVELQAVRSAWVNPNATDFAISVAGSERVRVDKTGNVGIGTGAPGAKLTIAAGAFQTDTENIRFNRTEDSARYNSIYSRSDATAAANNIAFKVHNAVDTTSQTEVMRLLGNGNVGIGTTNPDAKLDVAGLIKTEGALNSFRNYYDATHFSEITAKSNGDLQMYGFNGATYQNILLAMDGNTQAGNVGIGTTNPTHKLETYSDNGVSAYLGHSNTTGSFPKVSAFGLGSDAVTKGYSNNGGTLTVTGSAQIAAIQSQSSGAETALAFYTTTGGSVAEKMRIGNTGNIGIGTTNPQGRLHIGSTTYSTLSPSYQFNMFGPLNIMQRDAATDSYVTNNAFFNSGNQWQRVLAGGAGRIGWDSDAVGAMDFKVAPTGTAGSTFS